MTRRFVLLDRDGTIIPERHYLSDPSLVELLPGVATALRQLQDMGLGLVVLTNQSGIGRGLLDSARLDQIHRRLRSLLASEGVQLDGIYYCPHLPEDHCNCRKPETGLVKCAAMELGFDPTACFMVGDKRCDIDLGKRVGATTFLVCTGYGRETALSGMIKPDFVAEGLADVPPIVEGLLAATEKGVGVERTHC